MISKFTTGMIFSLDDLNSRGEKEVRHYYIVVGTPTDEHVKHYQAMSITSRYNKKVSDTDLPILLNDKVSYINTHNITSFAEDRIEEEGAYFGIVNDFGCITKTDLVRVCIECWMLNHYPNLENKIKLMIRGDIGTYREEFQKENPGKEEYRQSKVVTPMTIALDKSGVKSSLNIAPVCAPEVKEQELVHTKKSTTTVLSIGVDIPKPTKGVRKKVCPPETLKFIKRQLYELDASTKNVDELSIKTLEAFITYYCTYGGTFMVENFNRFKSQSAVSKFYQSASSRIENIIGQKEIKTVMGGDVESSFKGLTPIIFY